MLLITENAYVLCPLHAERWRRGGWDGHMHRALRWELEEAGSKCVDCLEFGPAVVRSIRVAGEAHCVEDSDGALKEELVASEQCDSCGSTREDGSQAPFVLDETGAEPVYACDACGATYRIVHTSDTETVF